MVIRYGQLNGPGTYYPQAPPAPPHVHIDAAVVRTVEVLDAPSQVVTVVQAPATRLLTAEDLASRINGRG